MKITEVRVIVTCPGRNYVFVKVMTDVPGLYGVGEGTLNGSEPIVAEAIRHMSHLLIGRDPQRIEDTWHLLYRQGYLRGGPLLFVPHRPPRPPPLGLKGDIFKPTPLPLPGGAGARAADVL